MSGPKATPETTRGRFWPPSRRSVVFAAAAGAVAALATATRVWINVLPAEGSINTAPIDVAGSDAATAVAALAVVALAGAVASAIAGAVARYVIAALLAASGVGIVASAVAVVMDPMGAAASAVGAAAGTPTVQGSYDVHAWPWVAAAAGAWIVVSAAVLAIAGRHWRVSRKYAAPAAAADARSNGAAGGPVNEIDGWDSLSRGEDPTR
jgi:uncharacterized membrane protein (TIGR02234 family)